MFRKMTAVASLIAALAGIAPGLAHADGWRGAGGDRRGEVSDQGRGDRTPERDGDWSVGRRHGRELSRWERMRWRHAMMRRHGNRGWMERGFGFGDRSDR